MSERAADSGPPLSLTQLILLGIGIACLFAGQAALQARGIEPITFRAIVPTLGGSLLILLAFSETIARRIPGKLATQVAAVDLAARPAVGNPLLFAAALAASATAASIAGDQRLLRFPVLSIGFWLVGIALVLVAASAIERSRTRLPRAEFIALLLIVAGAGAARLIRLGDIPWLLAGDEASVGLSAREFLQGAWNNPFGIAWYSFPALFFILPAASIAILGQTIEGLRMPAAIAGILTVIALYFYGRAAFGRWVAILAAAYLAFFHFHIHFSRIGLNNIWDALFLTLFSYLLWRAWSEERQGLFAWAGIVLGLGLYFYTSTRVVILILLLWIAIAFLRDRHRASHLWSHWLILAVAAIVVALPQITFFARHPDEFVAPMARVSLLGPWLEQETALTGLPAWRILANQMVLSAGAFTFSNLRHWYAIDHPMLLPISATLFLIGLGVSLWRAFDLRYTWPLLCLGGVVLLGGLSESTPAAQRYIVIAPIVAVLIALPLAEAIERLRLPSRRWQIAITVGGIAVLLAAVASDLRFYFSDYTPSRRFSDRNTELSQDLGLYLRSSGLEAAGVEVFFFGQGIMDHDSIPTLPYLAPDANFVDVPDPTPDFSQWSPASPAAFVFLAGNTTDLSRIRGAFPGGSVNVRQGTTGDELYTIYILR